MAGRIGQPNRSYLGAADRVISLAPRGGARDAVPFDDEAGEFFNGVRYGSQTAHHRPLAEQDARQFAGGKRRDIGELESHHGPFDAVDRIDNGRALLGAVGEGIPDSDLVVELAGEFIERPDGEHPALTVPDEHRPHPLALVVPGERSRQLFAVRFYPLPSKPDQAAARRREKLTLLGFGQRFTSESQ